jgi:hypothetical protein
MRLNYKPNNPVVTCICGRSIATRNGRVIPHQPNPCMKAKEPNCKASFMTLAELRSLKRVVVI